MKAAQHTLFGMWKLGTEEQQRPISDSDASPFKCEVCKAVCGNAGALEVHIKMNHQTAQLDIVQRPLSALVLQQIAWLKSKGEEDDEKKRKALAIRRRRIWMVRN